MTGSTSEARKDDLDRRTSIVEAAVRTLSNHGFRGATTRRIAKDAGVSEALLYKHFENKAQLLDAVLDHLVETFQDTSSTSEAETQELTDREFFRLYARRLLTKAQQSPEQLRILFYAGFQGHRLAGEYYERQVKRVQDELVERVRHGQREGRYRCISATTAAEAFLSMVRFQVLRGVIFDKAAPVDIPEDWPEVFVEIFLRGLSCEES